jgi:D-alanyl-D-alanine dipeptidase
LFRDYESLRSLARNFGGRTYDIDNASDRQAMKISLLRSLRPEALKVLEQIATEYHRAFDRPLPVSSLVRPEQYQHALSKVNRNAVLIDTPPHSTGLAFDIDYRYMSTAEQSFLMTELARMKNQGRIEVLRERSANYHVFAFIDGARPNDELIKASLDEASAPIKEAHHPTKKAAKARGKSQKAKNRNTKAKKRRR